MAEIALINERACDWLIAHEAFRRDGSAHLDIFVEADQALLEAFCLDWQDADPKLLRIAYLTFQEQLLKSFEADLRTVKHEHIRWNTIS